MVTAYDLRLGNIVKCKKSNDAGIYRVIALDAYNLKIMLDGARQSEWQMEKDIKPIKLTPEIIGKITGVEINYPGVYVTKWDIEHDGHYIGISYEHDGKRWLVTYNSTIEVSMPYLHVLQNVIYYNWGKELSITL